MTHVVFKLENDTLAWSSKELYQKYFSYLPIVKEGNERECYNYYINDKNKK